MSNFPATAKETTFGELVSTVSTNNKKVQKREYLKSGRFPIVDQGQQFIGGYCNDEGKVISEDLPLLVFGDHTRTFKYLDQPFVPGADGVKVLKPLGVSAKWLYHIAHALDFADKGYARHFQHLKNARLRVPSLPDQRRTVEEIEKQFSRLEVGVTALRRVQANLKRYRAAVLKAACEGRLVSTEGELAKAEGRTYETGEQLLTRILADRRKNWHGRGKYKEPALPDTTDLPSVPDGWTWTTIDQLSTRVVDGTHHTPTYVSEGIAFISVKDVRDGKVHFEDCKYVPPAAHEVLSKRCNVQRDDVLITKSGTIGRVAVVRTDRPFSLFVSVALIKPVRGFFDSKFLALLLEGYIGSISIAQVVKGGLLKNLHLEDLRVVVVGFPPLPEQARIVAEVERRLSVIDELEVAVTANLKRATRLRQAILRRAFSETSEARR